MASFNLFDIYVVIYFAIVIHVVSCFAVVNFLILYLQYQLFYCMIDYYFAVSVAPR